VKPQQTLYRLTLVLNALAWATVGVLGLVAPAWLLAAVHVTGDASGIAELRAMYGGMELGVAAFLIWSSASTSPGRIRTALVGATLPLAALGLVRLGGILTSDVVAVHYVLAGLELSGTVLNVIVLRLHIRSFTLSA